MPNTSPQLVRFGAFTADLSSGELWKDGVRIRLQAQPFEILRLFLERPNEVITREELQQRIWPSDTFVDFDRGLNKAVNKLRDALFDTAEDPNFIETIPKRGYRFIAPIEIEPQLVPLQVLPAGAPSGIRRPALAQKWLIFLLLSLFLVGALLYSFSRRLEPSSADLPSIAVLPLATSEPASEYDISDGLTDNLINDLSLVPNLKVISHASMFQYRGKLVDPRIIGQKLGVAAVLSGKVDVSDNIVTLNLELTATNDRRRIWGQQYVRRTEDRGTLPREAAQEVAEALRLGMNPDRIRQLGSQNTADAEAQQLYLKGRYYFFKEMPEDVLRARQLFQQAIDRDSTFALAYSALGDTYDWMATEGYQPLSDVVRQATAAKSRARELNDSLAEVHASVASLQFVQWNFPQAEIEFQKALQLNPNYFEAHRLYSIYLRSMKRFPEAIEHAKLCDDLNPLLMPAKSHLALTYYYARQYDAAAEQYRSILKDEPDAPGAHAGLAAVMIRIGNDKDAIAEWQKALVLSGDPAAAQQLGSTYSRLGLAAAQAEFLRKELQSLEKLARNSYVSPLEFAYRYALLDDTDDALRWLEKAYADRSPQLFNLAVDPDYDDLRRDPRFQNLLSRLHLPA